MNNGVIQKWHRECHKVMTYGFSNKNKTSNGLNELSHKSRGYCLVCGDEVTDKHYRIQIINTERGIKGTYIHGKCRVFWVNPKFTCSNSRIKVINSDNYTELVLE